VAGAQLVCVLLYDADNEELTVEVADADAPALGKSLTGTVLPADAIEPSELILPGEDATIEEVRELLADGGLIPG